MTDPKRPHDDPVGVEADDVLNHALRPRPVEDADEVEFDDDVAEDLSAETAESGSDGDDVEDYVLYSEVKPHLEALVALQSERAKMVDLLLYARDRVSSPAVATRMDDNLAQLGITVIAAQVGERFDPAQHEASATVLTSEVGKHGTIAELELAGYADGDRVIRHPIVTVYTTERDSPA